MSFNIGYVSVSRLFPTKFVATVFGIVNFISHTFTIGAPLCAEIPDPVPFLIFSGNAGVAIFACLKLVELDREKKKQLQEAKRLRKKLKNERKKETSFTEALMMTNEANETNQQQ